MRLIYPSFMLMCQHSPWKAVQSRMYNCWSASRKAVGDQLFSIDTAYVLPDQLCFVNRESTQLYTGNEMHFMAGWRCARRRAMQSGRQGQKHSVFGQEVEVRFLHGGETYSFRMRVFVCRCEA